MQDNPTGTKRIRQIVRLTGYLLVFVSLFFVARELMHNWDAVSGWRPAPAELGLLTSFAVLYGAALFLLAENWHRIVAGFGKEPRIRTYRSYTLTQIARYLPGNVAHLLGRAIVLRDGPLNDRQLALATLLELVVIPVSAIVTLVFAATFAPEQASLLVVFGSLVPYAPFAAAGIAILATGTAILSLTWSSLRTAQQLSVIGLTTVVSTAFMLILAGIFGAIVVVVDDGPFMVAAIAGICAWLVGYATPGAPGGLGPREATLVILLSQSVSPGGLLISAAVFRIVTVLGDILCFAAGSVLFRKVCLDR